MEPEQPAIPEAGLLHVELGKELETYRWEHKGRVCGNALMTGVSSTLLFLLPSRAMLELRSLMQLTFPIWLSNLERGGESSCVGKL